MIGVPLVIVFAPGTSLDRERDLISHLPIVRNGPTGTFVAFPSSVTRRASVKVCRVHIGRRAVENAARGLRQERLDVCGERRIVAARATKKGSRSTAGRSRAS
jgi:hypothetical protein